MRILIATTQIPFVRGGGEMHAENLRSALIAAGHEAEIVAIPFVWYPPERILDQILACRLLDVTTSEGRPIDCLIGLKFPTYYIPHPNKRLWILHQHRPAYDLWDSPLGDMAQYAKGDLVREAIRQADKTLIVESRRVFANSKNVAKRLKEYCGIESRVLYHPPPNSESLYTAEPHDYLFCPSRVTPNKRQDLVLKALAHTKEQVRVYFAGISYHPTYHPEMLRLVATLGLRHRVKWLGNVSDSEKARLYAYALGVIFVPYDEDYGYVTLEAMLASKPVITCVDSGGPLEFVANGETGLITEPTAESLAQAMDRLWRDTKGSIEMGKAGRKKYLDLKMDWGNVVTTLLA